MDILIFLVNWLPVTIVIPIVMYGIWYAFREISECYEDMSVTEKDKDSYKYIVAEGNVKNSFRNIIAQFLILVLISVVVYFKLQLPFEQPDSFIRAIITPIIFISFEVLLVRILREQGITRNKLRKKKLKELESQNG